MRVILSGFFLLNTHNLVAVCDSLRAGQRPAGRAYPAPRSPSARRVIAGRQTVPKLTGRDRAGAYRAPAGPWRRARIEPSAARPSPCSAHGGHLGAAPATTTNGSVAARGGTHRRVADHTPAPSAEARRQISHLGDPRLDSFSDQGRRRGDQGDLDRATGIDCSSSRARLSIDHEIPDVVDRLRNAAPRMNWWWLLSAVRPSRLVISDHGRRP
jgi:hypothetical protein